MRRVAVALLAPLALLALLALLGCGAEPAPEAQRPPRSTQLVLAGDGEMWVVEVQSERVRHRVVKELAPGDPMHGVVRRGDRFVFWGFATYTADDPLEPLKPLAQDTWFFIPSAHDDRVWLAFLEKGQPATSVRLAAIREVTADGRVTVADTAPPRGAWPLAAVRGGVVIEDDRGLLVWDPVSGREVGRVAGRFAGPGHGDVLATADPDECGELVLTDMTLGAERRVKPVGDGACWGISHAAFSPDGARLAISFSRRSGYDQPHELALVDAATGDLAVVPRSEVPPGYVFVEWSADGEQVFITGGARFNERTILVYADGAAAARRLNVRTGDFYDMAAR